MNSRIRRLGVGLAAAALLAAAVTVGAQETEPSWPAECRPDELLVAFQPGTDPATVAARHGATIKEELTGIDVFVLAIPPGTVAEKVAEFSADPEVDYAEPNGIMRVPEEPPDASAPCS